jgi:hypothetical protein
LLAKLKNLIYYTLLVFYNSARHATKLHVA